MFCVRGFMQKNMVRGEMGACLEEVGGGDEEAADADAVAVYVVPMRRVGGAERGMVGGGVGREIALVPGKGGGSVQPEFVTQFEKIQTGDFFPITSPCLCAGQREPGGTTSLVLFQWANFF